MELRIHRGTREIGGTCIELQSAGARIVLDMGLPLNVDDIDGVVLPDVPGLTTPDPGLLAIVLSHGHRDHWGLLPKVMQRVPLVIGRAVERVMRAAADFVPESFAPEASAYLDDRKPLTIGPFAITPWLVDHSGFDAYALEVEAEGRRLFYSGDLRAHGRKATLFERLVEHPPKNIDVMLMEGSSIGRLADDARFQTEGEIEQAFVDRFHETEGMALVSCSAQNIDRVVTVYRAAKRTGRTLLIDAYAAEVLKATGNANIPQVGWPNLGIFLPYRQRVQLKRAGIASLVDAYRACRIWPEELAARASRSVMLFRGWMMEDLAREDALAGARVFWSQWDGYLKDGGGLRLKQDCAARGIPFETLHTSGHASVGDLKQLAAAIAPKRLIPIHTFEANRFSSLFANVVRVADGELVSV